MLKKIFLLITVNFLLIGCLDKGDAVEELMQISDDQQLVVVMKTSMGTIEINLFANQTPKTVKNFVGLANQNYYNGVTFHRVIKGFMIQGGDSTGTGAGGRSFYGKDFEDEFVPELKHKAPGILSMANRGPNTNSSQFFITLAATPWLDGRHTVFGEVINGMDVVEAIGDVETSKPYDKPVDDVVIESVTFEKRDK